MKNNARVSIKTVQDIDSTGGGETIELTTFGRFSENGGTFYIYYAESEMSGFEDTNTLIKIKPDKVVMRRMGKYASEMQFVEGDVTLCFYKTPYGEIPIAVDTDRVRINLTEKGGTFGIDYVLDADNEHYIPFHMRVNVEICE